MTTNPAAQAAHGADFVRLPDPPEPEDMNNFKYLHAPGNSHHLAEHFGQADTTIVTGAAYISPVPTSSPQGAVPPGPAHRLQRRPRSGQRPQRLHHLGAGQAPGLRSGNRLAHHRPAGRHRKAGWLRRPGHPGILAL